MNQPPENSIIEVTPITEKNLNASRKWAMFLAVVGFIVLGLMIFLGIITGAFLSAFKSEDVTLGIQENIIAVMFIVFLLIYFLLVLYLFRFSKSARDAIQNHDRKKLEKTFRYLRKFFTLAGILVISIILVYLLILIISGASLSLPKGI
jgi:SNF family Na+-dependent transporter